MAEVWLEVHYTISKANLFQPGDYVVIDASGGKDSTVLAYIMNIEMNIGFDKFNHFRYNCGLKLVLLSIDEGVTGYMTAWKLSRRTDTSTISPSRSSHMNTCTAGL